ncbi:MAG: DUF1501 domain-containing protein [Woeseia sp.]
MTAINRREFIKASSAGAAAFAACPGAAFSQVIGTNAPFPDYKALVCVFLFGGNDSFNMLVPRSAAEYNVYAASRQNMAILQADLLPINPLTPDGALYGLHPMMPEVQTLFGSSRAAFVTNVGPLIEPTTKAQYQGRSVLLPPQLFSHNDQQDQWNSLRGLTPGKTGWAGRIADLIRTNVANQQMATNVSLFGSTLLQSADQTVAYVMGDDGPIQFAGFDNTQGGQAQRAAFEAVLNANYSSIYERGFVEVQKRAVASADLIAGALNNAPPLNTVFPNGELGRQLNTVARLIAVRDQLQMQRQIFFVATGGFDSHDDQLQNQPGLLGGVSQAMSAFYDATVELGVSGMVTSFTQSDFGRTLTSNGDGTDHAWGGNQLVIGDAVAGREMYGSYPLLQIDGPDDVGGGRIIPTLSADQYSATLSKWFGIPDADLSIVAPHIDNFVQRDLGFLL